MDLWATHSTAAHGDSFQGRELIPPPSSSGVRYSERGKPQSPLAELIARPADTETFVPYQFQKNTEVSLFKKRREKKMG